MRRLPVIQWEVAAFLLWPETAGALGNARMTTIERWCWRCLHHHNQPVSDLESHAGLKTPRRLGSWVRPSTACCWSQGKDTAGFEGLSLPSFISRPPLSSSVRHYRSKTIKAQGSEWGKEKGLCFPFLNKLFIDV